VGCDVHGDEGRILSLLHAVFYTWVETNLPITKILSLPSRPNPHGLHLSSSGICSFLFPFVTLPPPHTESIQRAPHNCITKTDEDITGRSQSLSALEKSTLSLTVDIHSIHTKPLHTSHTEFYNRLICSITFCTAFATCGERPTPAVKCLPSIAYTSRRGGSCCNARASPMASATPKAWVE
jgi:hypothetical protein